MPPSEPSDLHRRDFLKLAGVLAAGLLDSCAPAAKHAVAPATDDQTAERNVCLLLDPSDGLMSTRPVQNALLALRQSLEARNVALRDIAQLEESGPADICLIVVGLPTPLATSILTAANVDFPSAPESLALLPGAQNQRAIVLAAARDARGVIYALGELADRVANGPDPFQSLQLSAPIVERPANRVRSLGRFFVSNVEDPGWFNDRAFWPAYMAMLAGQRFNRFSLGLGLGYDAPKNLQDTYFYFAYPFLVKVPGYDVRATGLDDDERDRNLQTLRFISDQAAAHGLDFQLGVWSHAYQWIDSPDANYLIQGLTPDTHAAYCRDALHAILTACPAITGITLRVHGESGVPEGSYDFWKTLLAGIASTGRPINVDLHAKGMNQQMIDVALASGLPVTISPKFWAEHMGLPYLQSSIRESEMPREKAGGSAYNSISAGSRSFLRYSFGDLFQRDRRYGIVHRVWPGTQRVLLWADPVFAAGMGRIFNLAAADGVEYVDPLSFRGRQGSGLPGRRDGYIDSSITPPQPPENDWQKYLYTYRAWGRLAYNPASGPDVCQRAFAHDFAAAAGPFASALSRSSRILPLITSAHDPSAANAQYWPEMYTNMSLVRPDAPRPYSDTPSPKVFGTVSSLDPQLFASVNDCAAALLSGKPMARFTPLEVAAQLDEWADGAAADLLAARALIADPTDRGYRRLSTDAAIAAGLGRFFAAKFRAAVLYAIYEQTGAPPAQREAILAYRQAYAAWAQLAHRADGVYTPDITFGPSPYMRGHWLDRMLAIERDIEAVTAASPPADRPAALESDQIIDFAIAAVLSTPARPRLRVEHVPPASFQPGRPLQLALSIPSMEGSARCLWYRHFNQAEHWQSLDLIGGEAQYQAAVPAPYTDSPFALQYYFELTATSGGACLYPGFRRDFLGQPYFLVLTATSRFEFQAPA